MEKSIILGNFQVFFHWLINIVIFKPIIGIPTTILILGLALFVTYYVFKILFLICKKAIVNCRHFITHYGDGDLQTRSFKESKELTFTKLIYHKLIEQNLIRQLKQIYYPTKLSFITSFSTILLLFLLPWPAIGSVEFDKYIESNFYQNYVTIHAGIGAIILALLILVAETSNSGKQSDKARLILKETFVFPLVTLEIFSLLFFSLGIKSYGALASLFLVGILTIYSVYRVTRLLINRYIFQQKEQQLVRDRFSSSLAKKVSDRIATNTFLSYLKQSEFEIDYQYFYTKKDHIQTFQLSKTGTLSNIKLDKLERFLKDINQLANQNNYSIRKQDEKKLNAGLINTTVNAQGDQSFTTVGISVLKLIGDQVLEDRREILTIPKLLVKNSSEQKRLQKTIDSIFVVNPEDNADKEIRLELDETKEKAFISIAESRIGTLSSVMETYEMLVDQFLAVFQSFGGGYSSESASKERSSLFGGWSYTKWIHEDLMDIFNEAVKSGKDKLVKEITYTPIKILHMAFSKRDHLIFQDFLSFQVYLYSFAHDSNNEKIRNFLFDRSSRYLKEFSEYRITPSLDENEIEDKDIDHIKDFVFEIIQTYNRLLKISLDRKDAINFNKYLTDLWSLLHRFTPSEDNLRLQAEMELNASNVDALQKNELKIKLAKVIHLEKTEEEIQQKKDELIFGISAWCLGKLKEANFDDQDLITIWNSLSKYLPSDLKKLLRIFKLTIDHRTEKHWGWTWWDLEEKHSENGGVIMGEVSFGGKVHDLFALLLLQILKGKSEADIDISDLNIEQELTFYFDKDDSFTKSSISQIANPKSPWVKLYTADNETESLAKNLLSKLVAKQKKNERLELINTNIDSEKITEFIEDFVDSYNKEATLRKIFNAFKAYKDLKRTSRSKKYWGFNEIQDKEPFLKSWHIDYGGHGEHYGRGLASSEDQIIFNQLRSNATKLVNQQSLTDAITLGISEVENNGFSPSIIFTTFHFGEWRRSTLEDQSFIPSWSATSSQFYNWSHFIGLYKHGRKRIPIFRYWIDSSPKDISDIIIADLKAFVRLDQFLPYSSKKERDSSQLKEHFLFKVSDLSAYSEEKTREKLIKDKPKWLEDQENKDDYLKQKVIVHVKEKFELNVKDKKAGAKVTVNFPKD